LEHLPDGIHEHQGKIQTTVSPAPTEKSWMLQFGRYLQIGFALPAATLLGWFVGSLLDRRFHTSWLYMVGLIVGSVAGFIGLIRIASKPESDGDGS